MATSAPIVMKHTRFPARLAWLQERVRTHVRPYHLAIGAAVALISLIFAVVIGVMVLIATNFNLLGWIE